MNTNNKPEKEVEQDNSEQDIDPESKPRGRSAKAPTQMPPLAWRDILLRVKNQLIQDNLSVVAPGVAFLMLLAIFPAITSFVSIYGLMLDAGDVERQFQELSTFLPYDARQIIDNQLKAVSEKSDEALGIGAIASMLVAIWSATKGIGALMAALNIVYDETEKRSLVKFYIVKYVMTFAAIVFGVVSLACVAILPAVLHLFGLGDFTEMLISLVRWPVLIVLIMLALAAIYHYAPSRSNPKWRWVTPGAVVAASLWILASALFSWYVSDFARYHEIYGSLGSVVIMLMWLYLTVYVILLGGELNAEIEHQTLRDTTEGEPQPMGSRGAYVADTKGRIP